jgi:hypothetical protein
LIIPSSPDALSFFSFLYLFSGYIEIDILIEINVEMHVRRERVNLSPQVNTSNFLNLKKKLHAAPDAGVDDTLKLCLEYKSVLYTYKHYYRSIYMYIQVCCRPM